jgi:phosphohistidine phosphatase
VELFILRHGKAEAASRGMADAGRHLTRKGREEIEAVARWIVLQEYWFNVIATSPLARALETAAIVAEALNESGKVAHWESLGTGGDLDAVFRELSKFPEDSRILLVGHEPLLSSLIGRIITGGDDAGIVMTKGGLAKIRHFSPADRPSGELHWLITAKQMMGPGHHQ